MFTPPNSHAIVIAAGPLDWFPYLDLGEDQKVQEIVYSLDEDNDGAADPWELHDWIVWVEKIVHRHSIDDHTG